MFRLVNPFISVDKMSPFSVVFTARQCGCRLCFHFKQVKEQEHVVKLLEMDGLVSKTGKNFFRDTGSNITLYINVKAVMAMVCLKSTGLE